MERIPSEGENEAYALFFHASPRPMYVFDLGTLAFIDVNEVALSMYGYTREEFLALTLLDIRPPEEIPVLLSCLKEAPEVDHVWRHRRKDGSEVLVEAGWSRFETQGRPAQMAILTDVTEREKALGRVAASEAEFRGAVEAVLDGFAVLSAVRDPRGRLIDFRFDDANDAACELFGLSRDDLIGARASQVPPHDRIVATRHYADVVETGQPFVADALRVEHAPPGGAEDVGWFDVRAARLRDGVAVTFRDVTAAKEAERALQENETRFRMVFDASPVGIAVFDAEGRVIDANPSLCLLLDHDLERLRTLTLAELTHPEDVAPAASLARQLVQGEITSYTMETRYVSGHGAIVWVNLTAGVIAGNGAPWRGLVILEDITSRKHEDAERRRAAEEATRLLAELTPREREVLDLAAASGIPTRQLAQRLHVSARTAESHMASVYRKLHVTSRDSALAEYQRLLDATSMPRSTTTTRVRTEAP